MSKGLQVSLEKSHMCKEKKMLTFVNRGLPHVHSNDLGRNSQKSANWNIYDVIYRRYTLSRETVEDASIRKVSEESVARGVAFLSYCQLVYLRDKVANFIVYIYSGH